MTYDTPAQLKVRRDRLEAELSRVDNRIAMLDNLPEEPVFEDGEPSVIWFCRKFSKSGIKLYTWAAVRVDNGLWYLSGTTRSPSGVPWAELLQWIEEFGPVDIWVAVGWESL